MFLKDVYKNLCQNAICEQLHYILNSVDNDYLEFMCEIDKNTENFTSKQWDELIKDVRNKPGYMTFITILLECENIDKKRAIDIASSVPYDYVLLRRKDLEKDDIKEIISFMKPSRVKSILSDENIEIYQPNVTYLCGMNQSFLKKIDYLPYERLSDDNILLNEVNRKLNCGDCPEMLCTAIINNRNIQDKMREKAFEVGYNPTKLKHITLNIAHEIYPMLAEVVYERTYANDIDIKYSGGISDSLKTLIENNGLGSAFYRDVAIRQKNECYSHMCRSFAILAQKSKDSAVLSELQKIPDSDIWKQVLKNPAYDMCTLKAMDYKWFYANPNNCKDLIEFEKKYMLLRGLYSPFNTKPLDVDLLKEYIDKHMYDKAFMKTVIMSPVINNGILSYIENNYIPTLKTEEEKEEIKALIETTRIIKDCAFSTPIHQYISTKILLENLRNDKDVFLTSEPKNAPNRTIAYSEFVDIHKDVDKIDVNLSHSGIAMIGKYLMKMQKLFPNQKKLNDTIHNVYSELEDIQFFNRYKTKWQQFFLTPTTEERFYGDKMDTTLRMDRLNGLRNNPILLKTFVDDTLENCRINKNFATHIYNVINNDFSLYQLRTENYKILLENMKMFAPMYQQIEEIIYENRLKNNEITREEYDLYRLKFVSDDIKEKETEHEI